MKRVVALKVPFPLNNDLHVGNKCDHEIKETFAAYELEGSSEFLQKERESGISVKLYPLCVVSLTTGCLQVDWRRCHSTDGSDRNSIVEYLNKF